MVLFIAVARWSLVEHNGDTGTEETGEEKVANEALAVPEREDDLIGVEHPGVLVLNSLSAKLGL